MPTKDMDIARQIIERHTIDGKCYLMHDGYNFYVFYPTPKLWKIFGARFPQYNRIKHLVAQNTICEPFHRDLVDDDYYSRYNTFGGFTAKRTNNFDERFYLILDYIFLVLANNDHDKFRKILTWLSKPLKELKPNTECMILIGSNCGLSMISKFLIQYVYEGSSQFSFSLNGIISGQLLTVVDIYQFQADMSKLNNTGTSLLLTVSEDFTPKQSENLVFKVDKTLKFEENYFKDLYNSCMNQDVGDMFYTFLRDYNPNPMVKSANNKI